MSIEIQEIGPERLTQYAQIPIAFRVESILQLELREGGLGGIILREEKVARPYLKDYDADEGERPPRWAKHFDLSHWDILLACDGERPVGGTTLAFDTPGVHMLAGRRDLAVLWDIRVHPAYRRQGLGSRLLARAAEWARVRGCRQIKIETQNVNVAACRFYARQGCRLGLIDRYAYAHAPRCVHEVMLMWYLEL